MRSRRRGDDLGLPHRRGQVRGRLRRDALGAQPAAARASARAAVRFHARTRRIEGRTHRCARTSHGATAPAPITARVSRIAGRQQARPERRVGRRLPERDLGAVQHRPRVAVGAVEQDVDRLYRRPLAGEARDQLAPEGAAVVGGRPHEVVRGLRAHQHVVDLDPRAAMARLHRPDQGGEGQDAADLLAAHEAQRRRGHRAGPMAPAARSAAIAGGVEPEQLAQHFVGVLAQHRRRRAHRARRLGQAHRHAHHRAPCPRADGPSRRGRRARSPADARPPGRCC